MDKYQARYLKHQERKRVLLSGKFDSVKVDKPDFSEVFLRLVGQRQSQRFFSAEKISKKQLDYIKNVITNTPSSCNRQAIQIKIVKNIEEKKKLEELLVGGVGWISGADVILLLLADMSAYKSPAEVKFMPFLDAGFIGMSVYYASEALGLGSCFVNPNIREKDQKDFDKLFGKGYRFCGACVIGNYSKRALKIKKTGSIFLRG